MERKCPLSGKSCVSKTRQSRKRPGCIRLFVCPTTGGRLEISVSPRESILGLKTALARKLKTNPARIALIYKEKALTSGRLADYRIPEDSLLTLLPNMESGLSLQQSEKSITQALENLSETQVNDFLSGRAPLMLAIRMGENMVFVQLQLSTVQSPGQAQAQGQGQGRAPPRPSMTPMTPRTAALLSQSGLSASALARATRCLSRRIHHLQGGSGQPTASTTNAAMGAAGNPSQMPRASVPMSSAPSPSNSTSSSSSPSSLLSQEMAPSAPVMMTTASAPVTPAPAPQPRPTSTAAASSLKPSGPSLLQLPTSTPLPQNLPSSSSSSLPSPPPSPGAVINSLKHIGSGIYSGTFSGTLDPSLQEANGQPRRSVHTILHILKDLLVASPGSPQPQVGPQPSSPSSPPACSSSHPKPQHSHQVFFNQNAALTPPPSPTKVDKAGSFDMEQADKELLRGKMQRVQMMLAQRKELRGKRRQAIAPYPQQTATLAPNNSFSHCLSCSHKSVPGVESFVQPSSTLPAVTSSSSSSSASTSSSSSSTSTPPASSTNSSTERPRISSHVEEGCECSSSYGKNGMEHDSLVV